MTSCFVYRTKVESSARDVEELTKKLTQSESESVAAGQSAHTEKLQLQKRLEAEEAESKTKIAELTAEVSRLSALVDGAETNAAERMRREYESKFATLRTEHGKKLDSERRRFDSLVDANNKESAERLHRETEALRKTQAEMKKVRVSFYFRFIWAILLTGKKKCFICRATTTSLNQPRKMPTRGSPRPRRRASACATTLRCRSPISSPNSPTSRGFPSRRTRRSFN